MFGKLYNIIKDDKKLHDLLIEKGKYLLKIKGDEYSDNPDLAVKSNLICYNDCSFCPNAHDNSYLDLNKLVAYSKNVNTLVLSGGGESLLQPTDNLLSFLEKFIELNNQNPHLIIYTAGCNDKAPQSIKARYYHNLERVFNMDEFYTDIVFSYSGKQSNQRLKNFCEYYNYLNLNYPNRVLLLFRINYDAKHSKEEVFNEFNSVVNSYYSDLFYNHLTRKEEVEQFKRGLIADVQLIIFST